MIEHVWRRTAAARRVDAVLVATDDERVAATVDGFGGVAVMTSADHLTGTDRLAEVASELTADLIVNVQGDEPLIAPQLIARVAAALERNPQASVATACHPIHDAAEFASPNVVKAVLNAKGEALYFSRAAIPHPRSGEPQALRHVGIYAYRVGFLKRYASLAPSPLEVAEQLEQLRVLWHGYRIATVIEEGRIPPGVDTPADLQAVLKLLR